MSSEIARQRAEIEGVTAGRTLCDELRHVAETCGDALAYSDAAGDGWQSLTWSQARQRVLEVAAGFAALGLAPGERVALMLPNRSEHVLADLGAVHAGGLGVTLYATLAPEQVRYVAADCDARIAVLDGAAELARWGPVLDQLPGITKIVVRDPAACPVGGPYMTWDGLVELGRDRLAAGLDEITAGNGPPRPRNSPPPSSSSAGSCTPSTPTSSTPSTRDDPSRTPPAAAEPGVVIRHHRMPPRSWPAGSRPGLGPRSWRPPG